MWLDRRRALTAVLITDVPAGSQLAMPAALGLFAIARQQTESNQLLTFTARPTAGGSRLRWTPAPGATAYRIYASRTPIRGIYDLRQATLLLQTPTPDVTVPWHPYFAATAVFSSFENTALTPDSNTLLQPAPCPADFNGDYSVDFFDYLDFVNAFSQGNPAADFNADNTIDFFDYLDFVDAFSTGC
jgi:hypothetical protein